METKLCNLEDCAQRLKSFQEMKYTIDAADTFVAVIGDTIYAGENGNAH